MSSAQSVLPLPSVPSHRTMAQKIARGFRSAIEAYQREAAHRTDVRTALAMLSDMDDRTLADIGVPRGQISEAVRVGRR